MATWHLGICGDIEIRIPLTYLTLTAVRIIICVGSAVLIANVIYWGIAPLKMKLWKPKPRYVKGMVNEVGEKIIVDKVEFLWSQQLFQVDFHFESEPNAKKRMFIKKEDLDDAHYKTCGL